MALDQSKIDRVAELLGLKKKPEAPESLFVDTKQQAQQNASSLVEQGKQRVGQMKQNVLTAPSRYGFDQPMIGATSVATKKPILTPNPAFQNTVSGFAGMTTAPQTVKNILPVVKKEVAPLFTGFKDLSTTLLEKLQGKSKVSKQYISDLSNNADLKQPDKELIRKMLAIEGDSVNVLEFANKVKTELLPLTRDKIAAPYYENISLLSEQRGPIANYSEHIYQSPVSTSAGNIHFGSRSMEGKRNYFAHTRVEDLPKGKYPATNKDGGLEDYWDGGDTRRIIELQSDLFQKGRLEGEMSQYKQSIDTVKAIDEDIARMNKRADKLQADGFDELADNERAGIKSLESEKVRRQKIIGEEESKLKLEPYRNTWQDRIVREEIKQAAIDGKTKLQFPTGETAMKIEGLGSESRWQLVQESLARDSEVIATKNNIKIGLEVIPANDQTSWIITDVLGDGKFKAIQKNRIVNYDNNKVELDGTDGIMSYKDIPNVYKEEFNISGKVDQSNPIYKFYEKELGRYLQNKHGATRIKDAQGVEWYEVPIKPELKDKPVLAFGKTNPLTMMGGAAASSALVAANEADKKLSTTEYNKPLTPTPKAVIRGVPVHSNEVMLSKQAIFSEVSNRGVEIEPLTMLNVAINQAKKTGRPLNEILTDKNFFQGVANKRYATSTDPNKLNSQEKEVWDFVSRVVDNAISGELVDNTNGANHFVHITQGPHKDEVVSLNEEEFAHYWKGLKSTKEKTQFLEGLLGY